MKLMTKMDALDPHLLLTEFAKKGIPELFSKFVYATAPSMHRFLYRLLDDANDIEEVAQTSYIIAQKKCQTYRGPNALSWLFGIAFREVRTHRRKIYRQRAREIQMNELGTISEEILPHSSQPDGDPLVKKEQIEALRQGLQKLNRNDRLVLELVYLEGLKGKEAAEVLEVPLGTIKSRTHRALSSLKKILAPTGFASALAFLTPSHAQAVSGLSSTTFTNSIISSLANPGALAQTGMSATTASTLSTSSNTALWIKVVSSAALLTSLVIIPFALMKSNPDEQLNSNEPSSGSTLVSQPVEPNPSSTITPSVPEPNAEPTATQPLDSTPEKAGGPFYWVLGKVLGTDGKPLAGVILDVFKTSNILPELPSGLVELGQQQQRAEEWIPVRYYSPPATSDANGEFAIQIKYDPKDPIPPFWAPRQPNAKEQKVREETLSNGTFNLELVATHPNEEIRKAYFQFTPEKTPEVLITFEPQAKVTVKVETNDRLPKLDNPFISIIRRAQFESEIDHFIEYKPLAKLVEFENIPFGKCEIHLRGLPDTVYSETGTEFKLDLKKSSEETIELTILPKPILSGTITSPNGFGVGGLTLDILKMNGKLHESIVLDPTPKSRDSRTGELNPRGKGQQNSIDCTDFAATPTPFSIRDTDKGEQYTFILKNPVTGESENLGTWDSPNANLKLKAKALEPDRTILYSLQVPQGIKIKSMMTFVYNKKDPEKRLGMFVRHGIVGAEDIDRKDPQFWGLTEGDYTVVFTSYAEIDKKSYFVHTQTDVRVGPEEVTPANLKIQNPAWVRITLPKNVNRQKSISIRLSLLEDDGSISKQIPPRSLNFRWSGKEEFGFYVFPGRYLVQVHNHLIWQSDKRELGNFFELTVKNEAEIGPIEIPPQDCGNLKLKVTLNNKPLPKERTSLLKVEGVSDLGFPIGVSFWRNQTGSFEVVNLPSGNYNLSLEFYKESIPAYKEKIRFDGESQTIDWDLR